MLLTTLTEILVEHINTSKDVWCPTNFVVEAKPCIDYINALCQTGFKVLVVPETNQYRADEENSREWVKFRHTTKFISVYVGYTFTEPTRDDTVATWEETKFIVDARENLESVILGYDYSPAGLLITDIESQEPNEMELDRRNFATVCTFGFDDLQCNTQQESSSILRRSKRDTLSQGNVDSTRPVVLFERKLGRR